MGYVFGGQTGLTPEQAKRRRAIAEAIVAHGLSRAPQNIGEGLSAIGQALAARGLGRQADRAEREGRAAYQKNYGDLLPSLFGDDGGAADPVPTAPGGEVPPQPDLSQAHPEYLTGGGMPPPPTMENVANTQLPPPEDLAAMVRTVIGEAGNQSPEGQRAVAEVILNRARETGMTPRQVVMAKGQFEPWATRGAELNAIDPTSQQYQSVLGNITPAFAPDDPTGGADYFYAPKAQAALGRDVPDWARGQQGTDIGDHRFYSLGYGGDAGTSGAQDATAEQAAGQPGVQVADSGNGFDPRMIEALNDPWAPEGTKAVLGAILEQRMKQMGPHDPIKVGEGETLLDPVTHQPIYSGRQKPTSDEQNFAADQASGYKGSFHQWLTDRYGHPMVSIGPQGEQLPPPPSGFAYVHGPDGKVLFDDRGVPQILPMQGTKEYRDAQKAAESAASGKAQTEQTAGFVGQEVDRAIKQIKAAPEWTTGLGGQLLAGVGGTAANNVYELIRPIKSNISIDKLQQMRASSPTGAALGSVTTYEEEMLASAYGSLAMSQDASQLLYNLRRLKAIYGKVINEGIKPGDPIPTGDEETDTDSVPIGTTTDDPSQFKEGSTVKGEDGKTYIIQGGKPVPLL
jgi:hypothetical protein